MTTQNDTIRHLRQRWNRQLVTSHLLIAAGVAILLSAIAVVVFHATLLPVFVICCFSLGAALLLHPGLTVRDVIIYLDTQLPELQESAGLLVKDPYELNVLQQLQLKHNKEVMEHKQPAPSLVRLCSKYSKLVLFLSLTVSVALLAYYPGNNMRSTDMAVSKQNRRNETVLPGIATMQLTVTPPAYTHRSQRSQQKFNVVAEEGSHLFWNITATTPLHRAELIFDDKTILSLHTNDQLHFTGGRFIHKPGFYQLRLNDTLSELYRLEMISDQPPSVIVTAPKANTLIAPWMRNEIMVQAMLSDDYGISQAQIAATVASGSGEAVKFKQQQFPFPGFAPGSANYRLQQMIDLNALGMKKGDELYLYVSGTDNHGQEKRSDIVIVRLEDTAQLLGMEGLATGLDIKPEFFRSQRQIIIETEQLLREKDTLSAAEISRRSNNLGTDQKLLRLRYGKFLGEETDADIGHTEANEPTKTEDFNNAEKILDEVTHKHDIAEDAGYFDPQTKKQLKTTLAEMWKSELQLRLINPAAALPFAYAALRLLKDLQQRSRVYVAKTGIKTTPLKPEKRLSGELDKIINTSEQQQFTPVDNYFLVVRKAIGVLEMLRNREKPASADINTLQDASVQLAERAAADPGRNLTAYQSLMRIIKQNFRPADLAVAAKGLQQLLATPEWLPSQKTKGTDQGLSDRYFQHLNRGHD